MNYPRILVVAVALGALAACQPKGGSAGSGDTSPVLATVNGTPITQNFFDFYIKTVAGKPSSALTPEQRANAIDGLIRAELVAQQADKDGVTKDADTQEALELTRLNVLQQTMSERYLKDKKPTEQELRQEYETQVANLPKLEYHARHILVATEPFAQKVIERLEKGEKFEDVAKKESMDSSKDNGGDLGWFTPDRMMKPFADAVVSLKPGEYTHKAVQTQYGWHVIQLIDTRDLSPPPFDQVKQRLEQVVQTKKFRAYTDQLMSKAKVERKDAAPAAAKTG
ncbi:MAG TPA: peptidylprolyl isomerase [Steroidobacteraceae bacterium]|nr:peptidylprolyl isomerase [Steroidobacteraceae bacterium]